MLRHAPVIPTYVHRYRLGRRREHDWKSVCLYAVSNRYTPKSERALLGTASLFGLLVREVRLLGLTSSSLPFCVYYTLHSSLRRRRWKGNECSVMDQ